MSQHHIDEAQVAAIAPAWLDERGEIHVVPGDGLHYTLGTPEAARAAAARLEANSRFLVAPLDVIMRGIGLRLRQLADELAAQQREKMN